MESLVKRLSALLWTQRLAEQDRPQERALGGIKNASNDSFLIVARFLGEEWYSGKGADRNGMYIIPGILWSNLVALTTSSRRKGKILSKCNELGTLAASNGLGELLKELLTILLTTTDLIDTVDDDDTAVRSLKRALQGFDERRPQVLFVCFGVGGAARLVVGIYQRVVPVRDALDCNGDSNQVMKTHSARLPTRLDNNWYRMLLTTWRLVASDWTVPIETYIV